MATRQPDTMYADFIRALLKKVARSKKDTCFVQNRILHSRYNIWFETYFVNV